MGSCTIGLARDRHRCPVACTDSHNWSFLWYNSFRMRFSLLLLVLFQLFSAFLASPLDLGFGGVYNSPEANAYWARRFGSLFGGGGGLRQLQESINQSALSNRRIKTVGGGLIIRRKSQLEFSI